MTMKPITVDGPCRIIIEPLAAPAEPFKLTDEQVESIDDAYWTEVRGRRFSMLAAIARYEQLRGPRPAFDLSRLSDEQIRELAKIDVDAFNAAALKGYGAWDDYHAQSVRAVLSRAAEMMGEGGGK